METKKLSRSEQGAETKRRLTESALRLFAEKGYNNVSIADICGQVGVTVGVFYHYFKTKSDIVRLISQEGNEKTKAYVFQTQDPISRIAEILHYFACITADVGKDAMSVIITPANDLIYTNNAAAKTTLALVQEGQHQGVIDPGTDAVDLVKMLFAVVWGVICLWCQERSDMDLVEDMDKSVELALRALRA